MDEARTARLASLFDRALLLPRAARAGFARAACGDDEELRGELISLLEAHESADDWFDSLEQEVIGPVSTALVSSDATGLRAELEAALGDRYRIERELGGGAMSRVFLAEELGLERQVVIKVLPPELAATMSGERFRREIQLAARLQHPHIVPLLSADASGRLLYYVMPFVVGESLRARLAREAPLPIRDAAKIWRDLLDALAYAHARGVVHRDVKPGNILLNGRNALIADFGIARAIEAAAGDADATTPGLAIGTPAYMAPEQLGGDGGADHRADLYAAALVMYEMVEGRAPFGGASPREVALARLGGRPAPIGRAECPPELAALVMRCLEQDPAARPDSAEALLAELELPPTHAATPPRTRRRRPAAIALAALVVSGAALSGYLARHRGATPAGVAASPAVAVLPLANLGPETGDAWLAEGMTEELMSVLTQGGRLRVVAGTSVRALSGRQLALREIAESLGASHVLEGGLQKVGSKLRMQVRLVDARDGSTRWSATYDREIGDIFAVQDNIARAVAGELDARLAGRRRPTRSVAAYELYLRGKQTSLLRTAAGRHEAMDDLGQAIALDSTFAAAHAALVWLYLNEAGSSPGDYRIWDARADSAARKAVALDSTLADGWSALGWTRLAGLDLPAAEAALTRAVALDPGVYRGYEGLARTYMYARRPAEQLAAARRGLENDPFSIQALREMALALSMNGRCDEALELLRPLKGLTPPAGVAGVIRGQCYARKGMWPEAIAELRWAQGTADARTALGLLGYTLARAGHEAEARGILADLLAGRQRSHGAFGVALLYAGLRDYDRAFAWLERARQEGSIRVYIVDPLFDDLHRDPRFDRLFPPGRL